MQAILKNLVKIRKLKNITQEQMAAQLHMTQKQYSLLESGSTRMDAERLLELPKILGVSMEDLLSFDESLIFNNCSNILSRNNTQNNTNSLTFDEVTALIDKITTELKQSYSEQITARDNEIAYLRKQLETVLTRH